MKINLVCLEGHGFFSNEPEKWIGKECQFKEDGKVKCREELVEYVEVPIVAART